MFTHRKMLLAGASLPVFSATMVPQRAVSLP